jgi:hypothetical protein
MILQNLITFSVSEDYYRQRKADSISLGLSNSILLTEAMIVIRAVMKSLVFLYCLSIISAVHPAAASTTTPAAQEVQHDAWLHYATDEDDTAIACLLLPRREYAFPRL